MYDNIIIKKFVKPNEDNYNQHISQAKKGLNSRIYVQLFSTMALSISLIIGAINIMNNIMSIGTLFSIVLYIQKIYAPIISLNEVYLSIKSCQPSIDKILNILDTKQLISLGPISLNYNNKRKYNF